MNDFEDIVSRSAWVNLFLQACYQNRIVMESAFKLVKPVALLKVMEASQAQVLIYEAMCGYWDSYKSTQPAPGALAAAIVGLTGKLVVQTPESQTRITNEVGALFQSHMLQPISDAQITPVLELIRYIYQKHDVDPKLQELYQQGLEGRSLDSVYEEMTGLKRATVTGSTWDDPLSFKQDKTKPASFSSGLAWFDLLIGGGFIHGEAYSLIAPTGWGKTTLAGQLACALAVQGRKVIIWMTEQGFDEIRVKAKYWSVITGVPYETFLEYGSSDEVPEEIFPLEMKEIALKVMSNIICLDKRHITTLEQLKGAISRHKPDVVFVDWAGTLADALMQEKDNSFRGDRALCLRTIGNAMNSIAKEVKVAMFVFHQLGTHIKNALAPVSHLDSFECKSFSHNISFALVASPKDVNNITRISASKTRYGDLEHVIVKLNGANAKFEHMTGYKKGRGKWVPEGAPELGELPGKKVAVEAVGFR